jgi:CxxC-x17-CxxC domain-containing protein
LEFLDKRLTCIGCKREFVFSAGEQEFFAQKQLVNEPKRCTNCRQTMRESKQVKPRKLTDVVCAGCGVLTRVPFEPRGLRPVFCLDCKHTLPKEVTEPQETEPQEQENK